MKIPAIIFDDDNILPGLNSEDLSALGREDKPVLLKKGVIERNLVRHPEVEKEDFGKLLARALYSPDIIVKEKVILGKGNYYHFVKYLRRGNAIALIELSKNKDTYQIVHLQKMNDKNLKRLLKKQK